MIRSMGALAIGLFAGAALVPVPANAIIMRHDVDGARYRDLGEQYRGLLVSLAIPGRDGAPKLYNGMGTLIAPQWVLTAAHAAVRVKPGRPDSGAHAPHYVFIKGCGYAVKAVFLHPDWSGDGSRNDIALVELASPVEHGDPACLFSGTAEAGQIATLVGMGLPGNGLTGPGRSDGVLRGATVRIETAEDGILKWHFARPGTKGSTDLEGISAPGDSGGPALLKENGRVCVAGVSSLQDDEERGPGRYGVEETYTRVSFYLPWIHTVMKRVKLPSNK